MLRSSQHSPHIRSPLNARTLRRASCRHGSPSIVSPSLPPYHSCAICVPPATRAGGSAEAVGGCDAVSTGAVHEHTPSELSLAGQLSPLGRPPLGCAALCQRQSGSRQSAAGPQACSVRLSTPYCCVHTYRRTDHGTVRHRHNTYADGAKAPCL